jgi:hypothetical protein
MKKLIFSSRKRLLLLVLSILINYTVIAQCNNVGFENGNFSGWIGVYKGSSTGFDTATSNSAPNTNKSHCLMTTAGFDATLGGSLLSTLPPGGGKSMRLGNSAPSSAKESISYTFIVDASNTNFTYQYAVVLDGTAAHDPRGNPILK